MLVRRTLDRIAQRFPGGTAGNRNLTALLGAVLLVGILGELATLVLGLRQHPARPYHARCRADPDRGDEARVDRVANDPLLHARLRVPGRGPAPAFPARRSHRSSPVRRSHCSGSSVGLVAAGQQAHFFRAVHSASFALFLLVVGIHVVAHLPKLRRFALGRLGERTAREWTSDPARPRRVRARFGRRSRDRGSPDSRAVGRRRPSGNRRLIQATHILRARDSGREAGEPHCDKAPEDPGGASLMVPTYPGECV